MSFLARDVSSANLIANVSFLLREWDEEIDWICVDDQHFPRVLRVEEEKEEEQEDVMEKIRADGLTRGKESTYLFPRAEHANRVSHRRVLSLSLSFH